MPFALGSMLRRELGIALRSRLTWACCVLAALLVGHGFVLGLDLYVAASRSALADVLMRREMDPLSGIVRPTLGGAQLAVAIFVPLVAARVLGVEKERRSLGALALLRGGTSPIVRAKLGSAFVASLLVATSAPVLLVGYVVVGGSLDAVETLVALSGHVMHVALVAAVSVAASAFSRTSAQAAAVALVVSVASWAIDAGEGFAALAWLGPAAIASVSRALAPFEHGILETGAVGWFAATVAGASALAFIGARFDAAPRRGAGAAACSVVVAVALVASAKTSRGWDWTEYRRASLPPDVVRALRAIDEPIVIDVLLDREDSRRRHLDRDAFAKLRLARPDVRITSPLDGRTPDVVRDADYGKLVLHVGSRTGETPSSSRREIVVRIFEIAGRPLPDFEQRVYPGRPCAISDGGRTLLRVFAYGLLPGILLAVGLVLTRRRRRPEIH